MTPQTTTGDFASDGCANVLKMGTLSFEELQHSIFQDHPPSSAPPLVKALWHEKKGDWNRAHEIAQDIAGSDACWVHAYLHRREGDLGNAGYWYNRAGRSPSSAPLDQEWEEIARTLLGA